MFYFFKHLHLLTTNYIPFFHFSLLSFQQNTSSSNYFIQFYLNNKKLNISIYI